MKNLSEKLNLNYCDTSILLDDFHKTYNEDCPPQTNAYYKTLLAIKEKQDAGKVVTDEEYSSIPACGRPYFWSVAYYYFLVNFHYNFYNLNKYPDEDNLINKFLDFLAIIDFSFCRDLEVYNWYEAYRFGLARKYNFDFGAHYDAKLDRIVSNIQDRSAWEAAHFTEKEQFILQLLDAVEITKKNTIEVLDNVDRRINPKAFDNVWQVLKDRQIVIQHYIREFKDADSLKACDVMKILGISRRTLTRYVKNKTITTDSCINGKYRYNKESVFNLLQGNS